MAVPVDAVVWVADDRIATGLDYGVRLVERLHARGLRVERIELPATGGHIPAARLHVLSGGGTSVTDHSGWMRHALKLTRSLIDGARRAEHTVLGVCLGSQMIGETLWPGSVGRSECIKVGLAEVGWQPSNGSHREQLVVPTFHYEEIDRRRAIAAGARVVAEDSLVGLQAFQSGDRVWGVQFHPEFWPADVRRLIAHHQATIDTHGSSAVAALESVAKLEPRWSPGTFDLILDQVTGAQ